MDTWPIKGRLGHDRDPFGDQRGRFGLALAGHGTESHDAVPVSDAVQTVDLVEV